jgi:hypothetical protein
MTPNLFGQVQAPPPTSGIAENGIARELENIDRACAAERNRKVA